MWPILNLYSRTDIDESSSYIYNSCNESYFLEMVGLNLNWRDATVPCDEDCLKTTFLNAALSTHPNRLPEL